MDDTGLNSVNEQATHDTEGMYCDLALAQAAALARSGHYAQAQAILDDLLQNQHVRPDVLDLLARTHAQQGNFDRAAELWQLALELTPGNRVYQAGLKQAKRAKQRPGWVRFFSMPLLRYMGIAVIWILVFVVLLWLESGDDDNESLDNNTAESSLSTGTLPPSTPLAETEIAVPAVVSTPSLIVGQDRDFAATISVYEATLTSYLSHVVVLEQMITVQATQAAIQEGTIAAQATQMGGLETTITAQFLLITPSVSPTPTLTPTLTLVPTDTMTPPATFTPSVITAE